MDSSEPRAPHPPPTRPDGRLASAVVLGTLLVVAGVTTWRVGHYEARATGAELAHRAGEAAALVTARLLDDRELLEGALAFLTAEGLDDRRGFDAYLSALRLQALHPGVEGVGTCRLADAPVLSPLGWAGVPCADERRAGPLAGVAEGWAELALLGPEGADVGAVEAAEPGLVHLSGRRPLARSPVLRPEDGLYLRARLVEPGLAPGPLAPAPPRGVAWAFVPERLEALEALAAEVAGPGLAVRLEDAAAPPPDRPARFEAREVLRVGDGRWALRVSSTPAFEAAWRASSRQALAAWAGSALALLVAALTLVLGRGRDDALAEAQRLESDLLAADQELGMRDEALARVVAQLDGCNATADRLLTVVHTLPHPSAPEPPPPSLGASPAPVPAGPAPR